MSLKVGLIFRTINHLSCEQILSQLLHRCGVRGWMFRSKPNLRLLPFSPNMEFLPRDIINHKWTETDRLEVLGVSFEVEDLMQEGFDPQVGGIVLDTLSYLRYIPPAKKNSHDVFVKTLCYLRNFSRYCRQNSRSKARSTTFNSVERVYSLLKFMGSYQLLMSASERNEITSNIFENVYAIYHDQEARLGGNHHLRCLLCLSLVFDLCEGDSATLRIKKRIIAKTIKELDSQFLSDGMHYELSPGYHRLMLMDILDYLELCSGINSLVQEYLLRKLPEYLNAMRFFSTKAGKIPQFNDNLPDSFPPIADILVYAEKFGRPSIVSLSDLCESGFYSLKTSDLHVYLKAGSIGAHNQLAHAHSDNLSFELFDDEGWVCGNLPTSSYTSGPARNMTRAEPGSSAPQLKSYFQAEHWGVFRVGKCSLRSEVVFDCSVDPYKKITASHIYTNHSGEAVVERTFKSSAEEIQISTTVKNSDDHLTHLFAASSSSVSIVNECEATIRRNNRFLVISLVGCSFEKDIFSIYSDIHKEEYKYLKLRSSSNISYINLNFSTNG